LTRAQRRPRPLAALGFAVAAIAGVFATFPPAKPAAEPAAASIRVPILVYHRFGPTVRDGMTVRTPTFEGQLRYLKEHGHTVVPLRALVARLRGDGPALPDRAVVITADDGHKTVATDMAPLVRRFAVPVTLFFYPSAISNATYAMTWRDLETLRDSGLFDIQSHTYWHPNFKVEKRRLDARRYREFWITQLCKPRAILRERLGIDANLLAWPFGIHDDELAAWARDCGYRAALTLERRAVTATDQLMALPRFLVTDADVGPRFAALLR
jgi:peptidoglycan/xylan/chitin deacetylase (PgdA/CDA1 family)